MKKTKIIPILFSIIIIAGIVITGIWGLNFSLLYSAHKEVNIQIGQEFENKEVKELVKEVVGNQKVSIQKVELYEDMVAISLNDISDEQLENLNAKMNEKYGIENKVEDIQVNSIPKLRGRDLIKPYIAPVSISFIMILIYIIAYVAISNHMGKKIKMVKAIVGTIELIVEFELLYLAILAITRLPVSELTIPIAIVIYVLTTIGSIKYLEKQQ